MAKGNQVMAGKMAKASRQHTSGCYNANGVYQPPYSQGCDAYTNEQPLLKNQSKAWQEGWRAMAKRDAQFQAQLFNNKQRKSIAA